MPLSPLIGVTQRVVTVPRYGERRDALDQAWALFLAACGLEPLLIPNRLQDPVAFARRIGIQGLILTGGNDISGIIIAEARDRQDGGEMAADDSAPERDRTERELLEASVGRSWPVLGVCRGMQMLNVYHGGRLSRVAGHAGTRHDLAVTPGAARTFPWEMDRTVNSFHNLAVLATDIAPGLNVVASVGDVVEAVVHSGLRHLGIMWHPERNHPPSANDIALFRGFFHRQEDSSS